jgi:hypothetical protein
MKIRYKKITRSTEVNPSILIKKILSELDSPGYKITKQTQNCVEFKYNHWRFGSNFNASSILDGGVFDIIGESKTITLSYYLSPTPEIFLICFFTFFGIIQDYNIFFVLIPIAILFVVRLLRMLVVGDEIIDNICGRTN